MRRHEDIAMEEKSKRTAELGLRTNIEWRSRGYLPHRDSIGLLQSITFRLADKFTTGKAAGAGEDEGGCGEA
jgi:hypothetical protein